MSNGHERVEELLAVRALGGMEATEVAEYERIRTDHGLDCEICLRSELEFDEIAGRLAFALGPAELPAGMEDALLERATSEGQRPSEDELAARRERRARREPGAPPRRTARIAIAVAAAVALVAGAFAGGYFAHGPSVSPEQQALATYLASPDAHLVQFKGKAGNLAVAYRPGTNRAFVFGSDLQDVPSGKQYELWLFPPGGGAPSRGPTFDAPAPGTVVVVPVQADASKAALMAVTVEKAGGVNAPTQNPVLTAPIQPA